MRLRRGYAGVLVAACIALVALPCLGAVKLPAFISDNMVLQQGMKAPIWGTADPGEKITVRLGAQTHQAVAGADGRWMVRLDAISAAGPYEITVAGQNTLTVKNVMVGEVWVCSGQSNMQMSVGSAQNSQQEAAQANYPAIREFRVDWTISTEPKSDCGGKWEVCTPQSVGSFSAVAYFFGRDLHRELGVPVGLINTSWGGTEIELWMDRPTFEADPELKSIVDRSDTSLSDFAKGFLTTDAKRISEWYVSAGRESAAGKPISLPPLLPRDPRVLESGRGPSIPSSVYHAMVAPLVPYAMRGAIWYQGEANAGEAYKYRKVLPAMIAGWRRTWGQGDFPFLFVQLANFDWAGRRIEPGESTWAELREAQTMTLSAPKTGMAVTIDIGEGADIHPKNKQEVGRRLALAAQSIAYGKTGVYSGPIYDSMAVEGSQIRIRFKYVGSGLEIAGGDKIEGFAIAGRDRRFVWADATIDGDTVLVSGPKIADPVAVRYAWANDPSCNLYNREGLPASPFRTDDWPGITAPK